MLERQRDLKKWKRKIRIVSVSVIVSVVAVSLVIDFLGPIINSKIPKTFTYGDYSIKLTGAFDGYGGEWNSSDATVYCYSETKHSDETAADYLIDTNKSYEIDGDVTSVSDTSAWTTYTSNYEQNKYYNYDYVIESNGNFWYTEFYCLAEDADKYKPLFEKWAQTIEVSLDEN